MDAETVSMIITLILGLVSTFAGAKWGTAKNKASQLSKLLNSITDAAQDDQVTEAEFQVIVKNAKDLTANE